MEEALDATDLPPQRLEGDFFCAFELKNFSSFLGGRDAEAQTLDDFTHLAHLLCIGLRQLSSTNP